MKKIGILLLAVALIIIFVEPVRNYINSLFYNDKGGLEEQKIIGTTYNVNPRVKEIQEILKKKGFSSGSIDGRMGERTREAIKMFQKAKSLKATGTIDQKTWAELHKEIPLNKDLRSEINDNDKKIEIQDKIMNYRLKSSERVKQIQMALKRAGFYKGEIDGRAGPETKKATTAFQKSKGLHPDGIVGARTWEKLKEYIPF